MKIQANKVKIHTENVGKQSQSAQILVNILAW